MRVRLVLALVLLCALCNLPVAYAAEVKELTVMMAAPPADKPNLINDIIAKFEKLHPDIKVKNVAGGDQKLLAAIAGGQTPDVSTIGNNLAIGFFKSGGAYDLNPFIKADNFDLSQIPPNHESMMWQGHWYGMPQAGGAFADRAIFYNKDMYNAAGLAEPTYKWTWEQFAGNVQKLTKDTKMTAYTNKPVMPSVTWSGRFMCGAVVAKFSTSRAPNFSSLRKLLLTL